jgi:hypothetical protein
MDTPTTYPIHHDSVCAKTASEDGGSGHFNLIEWPGRRYQVVNGDGGLVLHEGSNKREAYRAARAEARDYDASSMPGPVSRRPA